MVRETRDETERESRPNDAAPLPGVVLLWSTGPRCVCAALDGGAVRIGRDDPLGAALTDERLSRHHVEIAMRRGAFVVRDLGSRNGTCVDGASITGEVTARSGAIVRAGGTILVLFDDVRPLLARPTEIKDDVVRGPKTANALDVAMRAREPLAIVGETGTGKEVVARAFHDGKGPFVAVNCAPIQEALAERILFGAKRGAFSGATSDAEGLVQSAHGGVLFLDEVCELTLPIQAKLLRVIETKQVTPVGATGARKVDVRFCLAAQNDLRARVDAGVFRPDLLFRIRSHVALAPVRERPEEIPFFVARQLEERDKTAHAKLVEACLMRRWPGNVREIIAELALAAEAADEVVRAEHLREGAGNARTTTTAAASSIGRDAIVRALEGAGGNISAAARALGMHRTQLKRAMQKFDV
ncbi:MAG TPA: sigma 54-interacting transcriptional regulator [Polyangiaceae bacterium]|nr:sigma 54-interacting transcriptional regulator [Polyangiaceae bacterium]